MNESNRGRAYRTLKSKLNNLLEVKTVAGLKKSLTGDYSDEEVPFATNMTNKRILRGDGDVDLEKYMPFLNQSQTDQGKKISTLHVSLQTAGIIVIVMMMVTCCCTLYLRNRLMALVHRIIGKRTKDSKLLPVDVEKGKGDSRSGLCNSKRLQKGEIKTPGQDVTRTVPQGVMTTTSSIQAEPSSTTCCRCFKKKRKKSRKKRKR